MKKRRLQIPELSNRAGRPVGRSIALENPTVTPVEFISK